MLQKRTKSHTKKYSHGAMTCYNIMQYLHSSMQCVQFFYIALKLFLMKLHSSASSSSTIVFGNNDTFQHVFDYFQVFTIVEVCFTIKLCLTFSETRFFVKTTHAHKTEEFHECFQSQKCWKFRKKILFNILHISKNCLLKNIPNLKYMPNQKKYAIHLQKMPN